MSTFVPFSLAKYGGKLLFMKTQSPNFSAEQIGLLRRNLCRELSEDDFALFVQACERTGLDPFARHIYPMPKFVWRGRQQSFVDAIVGKRLTYAQLIAKVPA